MTEARVGARLFVRGWRAGLGLRMRVELDAARSCTGFVGRDDTRTMWIAGDVARRRALAWRSSAARRIELPRDLASDLLGQRGEVRAGPRWAHARIEPLPAEAALHGRRLDLFSAERAGLHGSGNVSQPAAWQALGAVELGDVRGAARNSVARTRAPIGSTCRQRLMARPRRVISIFCARTARLRTGPRGSSRNAPSLRRRSVLQPCRAAPRRVRRLTATGRRSVPQRGRWVWHGD